MRKKQKSLIAELMERPVVEIGGMRIRLSVKDHSDLSWMRSRPTTKQSRRLSRAITEALNWTREDKKIF